MVVVVYPSTLVPEHCYKLTNWFISFECFPDSFWVWDRLDCKRQNVKIKVVWRWTSNKDCKNSGTETWWKRIHKCCTWTYLFIFQDLPENSWRNSGFEKRTKLSLTNLKQSVNNNAEITKKSLFNFQANAAAIAKQVQAKQICPTDRGLTYLYVVPATFFGKNRAITGQTELLPSRQRSWVYGLPNKLTIENVKNPKRDSWTPLGIRDHFYGFPVEQASLWILSVTHLLSLQDRSVTILLTRLNFFLCLPDASCHIHRFCFQSWVICPLQLEALTHDMSDNWETIIKRYLLIDLLQNIP